MPRVVRPTLPWRPESLLPLADHGVAFLAAVLHRTRTSLMTGLARCLLRLRVMKMDATRDARTTFMVGACALTASLSIACGHSRLLPASSAETVIGAPTAAVAVENGVRVTVDSDSWRGDPEDLAERLTPIKVRITNKSGKPVRVMYEAFRFRGKSGRVYRARPVVSIAHDPPEDSRATIKPIYTPSRFFVAKRLRDVYLCCDAWPEPLPRDDALYERQYRAWRDQPPTRQMKRESMPEGVLEDGGVITGYLYFDNVTGRETVATFQARLEDGEAGRAVANLEIPFSVN
jgi:hypothetical protein